MTPTNQKNMPHFEAGMTTEQGWIEFCFEHVPSVDRLVGLGSDHQTELVGAKVSGLLTATGTIVPCRSYTVFCHPQQSRRGSN